MDRLPIDLTTNILTRLPIRSVFRCRSVQKAWRSIIDDPQFSMMQFNFNSFSETGNPSSLICVPSFPVETPSLKGYFEGNLYILEEDEGAQAFRSSTMNLPCLKESWVYLAASCNGLICFCATDVSRKKVMDRIIYICNPTTREVLRLPEVPPLNCRVAALSYGFGFDCVNKEFKFVIAYQKQYSEGEPSQNGVVVYSLGGSSSWRNITYPGDVIPNKYLGTGAFLNNSVHWLNYNDDQSCIIISYDIGRERFDVIPMPDLGLIARMPELVVLGGCLCLPYRNLFGGGHFEIWVMKDYNVRESWAKLFVIESHVMKQRLFSCELHAVIRLVCLRGNDEILLLCNSNFLVYNHESGIATPLGKQDLPRNTWIQALPYVRTLASLESTCNLGDATLEKSMNMGSASSIEMGEKSSGSRQDERSVFTVAGFLQSLLTKIRENI